LRSPFPARYSCRISRTLSRETLAIERSNYPPLCESRHGSGLLFASFLECSTEENINRCLGCIAEKLAMLFSAENLPAGLCRVQVHSHDLFDSAAVSTSQNPCDGDFFASGEFKDHSLPKRFGTRLPVLGDLGKIRVPATRKALRGLLSRSSHQRQASKWLSRSPRLFL
jgi:hypothetical protein